MSMTSACIVRLTKVVFVDLRDMSADEFIILDIKRKLVSDFSFVKTRKVSTSAKTWL